MASSRGLRCSVVVGFVDADRAALPVAGRLDPGLVEAALVDRDGGAGASRSAILPRPRHSRRRSSAASARGPHRAAAPDPRRATAADATQTVSTSARLIERLLLLGSGDRGDDDGAGAGAQFLQPAADRRQRGLVADEQVPVEIVRHDERAARPADAELLAGLGLRCPVGRRSGVMQGEVDDQLVRVVTARRVVASRRARDAFGRLAVRTGSGMVGAFWPGSGKNTFTWSS